MKEKFIQINLPNSKRKIKLYLHESTDDPPLGLIIDVYDEDLDKLYDSYIVDYDDVKYEFYEDDED